MGRFAASIHGKARYAQRRHSTGRIRFRAYHARATDGRSRLSVPLVRT